MEKFYSYVEAVTWERIYMFLTIRLEEDYEPTEDIRFFLVDNGYKVETAFEILSREGNVYHLKLNVTNNGLNRCVNNGTHTIVVVDGDDHISEAGYHGTSQMLEAWSRCYRYNNNSGAYTVTFLLDEYAEESRFLILFYNTVKRGMGNMFKKPLRDENNELILEPVVDKVNFVEKWLTKRKKKIKAWVGKQKRKLANRLFNHWYRASRRKTNRPKTVLFLSEQDDKLALNMQALLDRMQERGLDNELKITFSLRKATSEPQTSISYLRLLNRVACADIIIVDDHVPLFNRVVLPDDIKMIQIWHAGAGFKGVGYSRWGHAGCPGPFSCHRQYDFCISGSTNISEFFSEQFGILDEQIIPTGMPRMDTYLNTDNREKVTQALYDQFPQAKGRKVILFAPTYRGQNRAKAYYPYEKVDFEDLYQFCCDEDYVVFFKMHPWVAHPVPIAPEHSDRFFDLNTYPNINELFYITDLLVTDYSSSIYEFSLMDKPMMFFAYDKVQYSTSRGFHRDYDSTVPGPVCETFEEVMQTLRSGELQIEKVAKYREDHFDFVDDHASDRVIDWLILGELPEKYAVALEKRREAVNAVRGLCYMQYFVEPETEESAEAELDATESEYPNAENKEDK